MLPSISSTKRLEMDKPQPGAAVLSRVEISAWRKGLKQAGNLFRCHANAAVTDKTRASVSALALPCHCHQHLPAFGELNCVVDQIDEDLTERSGSPSRLSEYHAAWQSEIPGPCPGLLRSVQRLSSTSSSRKSVVIHVQPAGFDLRKVEDVVDDASNVVRGFLTMSDSRPVWR